MTGCHSDLYIILLFFLNSPRLLLISQPIINLKHIYVHFIITNYHRFTRTLCLSTVHLQVSIWDTGSARHLQKILSKSSVIDICQIKSNENSYLVLLTEKELAIHKWTG